MTTHLPPCGTPDPRRTAADADRPRRPGTPPQARTGGPGPGASPAGASTASASSASENAARTSPERAAGGRTARRAEQPDPVGARPAPDTPRRPTPEGRADAPGLRQPAPADPADTAGSRSARGISHRPTTEGRADAPGLRQPAPADPADTAGSRSARGISHRPTPEGRAEGAGLSGPGAAGRSVRDVRGGAGGAGERRRRIEGLLLGLAAGDAAGWPAARHRAARMPEWTRRLTRELDTFAEQNATTTLPVPIALNQPPEPLRLGPSDDAEWAAFTAESVLASRGAPLSDLSRDRRVRAAVDLAWMSLASEISSAAARAPEVESAVIPLRARISVRAGLGNLATGLRPPATGHDNPHFFDDAACGRACVLAVVHPGDPAAAADLAEYDARYTQDEDGVHGARAMAAAVALALGGAPVAECVAAALGQLPPSSEIARNAEHAVGLARAAREAETRFHGQAFGLIPLLEHQIIDHVYSYGIAAADTVPVALALVLASDGTVSEAVPAAACLSRVADSAPALAGALAGALGGADALPDSWRAACRTLAGCALPRLAGADLVELAGRLAAIEPAPTAPERLGGLGTHEPGTPERHEPHERNEPRELHERHERHGHGERRETDA